MACLLWASAAFVTASARAGVPLPLLADGTPSLAPMLEEVLPGVVNVVATGRVREQAHPLLDDLMSDFATLESELAASRDAEQAELHAVASGGGGRTVQRALF